MPLKVVSEVLYWQTEPVRMDKPVSHDKGVSIWQFDSCTGPSLNNIKINVWQNDVTWPNKSNIVIAPVLCNLYEEKNTADIYGEACVTLSVVQTLRHISSWKTAAVTGKKL